MANIACKDCGHHRLSCPANTKRCKKCRLLIDVEFWTSRPLRECRNERCPNIFAPISRHDLICGPCHMGQTINLGRCAICKRDDRYLLMRDLACCEQCARSPELRTFVIAALRAGQRKRKENPPTEPLPQPKARVPVHEPLLDPDEPIPVL